MNKKVIVGIFIAIIVITIYLGYIKDNTVEKR